MSVNVKKCSSLDSDLARTLSGEVHPAEAQPEETALPLPPGFDASLFTPEQTEYISDLFVATVREYLRRLDEMLSVTEPGVSPTALRMGVNWFLLRKLAGISDRAAAMSWHDLRLATGATYAHYSSQRRALFSALRGFSANVYRLRK